MYLNINELDNLEPYSEWRNGHIVERKTPLQGEKCESTGLLEEVLSFRIEAHTPLDCMMFLSHLKEKYGNGGI